MAAIECTPVQTPGRPILAEAAATQPGQVARAAPQDGQAPGRIGGALIGRPRFKVPSGQRRFREPDAELSSRMYSRLEMLVEFAKRNGLRAYFFTLSSRAYSLGFDERVMVDLKRGWDLFQQSTTWRRVPGALWVFGDHERPHIHCVAVLPASMTVHNFRDRWRRGHSNAVPVRERNFSRLAAYLAAQRAPRNREGNTRRRFHGFKAPRWGA